MNQENADRNKNYDDIYYESIEDIARGEGFWIDDDGHWQEIEENNDGFGFMSLEELEGYAYDADDLWDGPDDNAEKCW